MIKAGAGEVRNVKEGTQDRYGSILYV